MKNILRETRWTTWGQTVSRWLCGASLLLLAACGSDSTSPGKVTGLGAVVVWGSTSMVFNGSSAFRQLMGDSAGNTDDYVLVRNILTHLSGKTSRIRILYTSTCDPRTDPDLCRRASSMDYLTPFYDMIASIGTITHSDMSSARLSDYDVVIADFCDLPSADYPVLRSYLSTGGAAMVLADNFCTDGSSSSAALANTVVADLGVTFSNEELYERERLLIPSAVRTGLLAGVTNLSMWRTAPQLISEGFIPIVTFDTASNHYVLSAIQKH